MTSFHLHVILSVLLVPNVRCLNAKLQTDINYKTTLLSNITGRSIDLKNLVLKFSAFCPLDETCEVVSSGVLKSLSTGGSRIARYCKRRCEPGCIKTHDCCPGCVHGYLHYACVDIGIFPDRKFKSYYMINQCANTYNGKPEIGEKCQSHNRTTAPVTSRSTNLTYSNINCAWCNGETNIIPWQVNVECERIPPNLFRYSMLLTTVLEKHKCNATFRLKTVDEITYRPTECPSSNIQSSQVIYDSCNMTGLWSKFDKNINWACENLDSYFYYFKNVFCYICNPSLASSATKRTINICNVTGKWENYDKKLDLLCQYQPQTSRISPFKNIYCLLCNGHDFPDVNRAQTIHMNNYRLVEKITDSGASIVSLISKQLSGVEVFQVLQFLNTVYGNDSVHWSRTISENQTMFDASDIKELVSSYIAACGDGYLCASQSKYTRYVPQANIPMCGKCSCDINCIENYNCCPDLVLHLQPYTCVARNNFMSVPSLISEDLERKTVGNKWQRKEHHTVQDGYLVINKCSDRRSKYLHLCEDEKYTKSDFLSNIPLEFFKNTHNITYKNIYCFLCNRQDNRMYGLIVNIQLHCNTLLEPFLVDHLYTLLTVAKSTCKTTFVPSQRQVCKSDPTGNQPLTDFSPSILTYTRYDSTSSPKNKTVYTHCNQTGYLIETTKEIKEVCEGQKEYIQALPVYKHDYKIYKNFACFICNPGFPSRNYSEHLPIWTCSNSYETKDYNFTAMQCMARGFNPTWLPFKNFFCEDCNLQSLKTVPVASFLPGLFPTAVHQISQNPGPEGKFPTTKPSAKNTFTGGSILQPTFRFLFSIHQTDWLELKSHENLVTTTPPCDNGTYDRRLGSCRQLYCDDGRALMNGSCQLLSDTAEDVDYLITILLTQVKNSSDLEHELDNQTLWLTQFCRDIPSAVTEKFENSTHFRVVRCNASTKAECDNHNKVSVANCSQIVVSIIIEIISTDQLTDVEDDLVASLDKQYTIWNRNATPLTFNSSLLTQSEYEDLWHEDNGGCMVQYKNMNVSTNENGNLTFEPFVVSPLMSCLQVELTSDEFEFDNQSGRVIVLQNGLNKSEKVFKWHNSSVRICKYHQPHGLVNVRPSNGLLQIYTLYSRCCISLSLVGLLLTLLTYLILPSLRTIPGRNIMTLSMNLFIAQSLLEFGIPFSTYKSMCTLSGVSSHYFWLSTFCAMNVCSFHTFRTICIRFYESRHPKSISRQWVWYVCYTQGAPLAVVAITISVYLANSRGTFIGYGKGLCFLSDTYSLIFAFLVPVVIIFVTNIAFFIAVFYKIRSTPHLLGSTDKRDLLVFVRLSAIVGITWPLQVVDGVFHLSVFSFFATTFNGLQGVYIFLSYVCNTRVFDLYRSLLSRCLHTTRKFGMESRDISLPPHTSSSSTELYECNKANM